MTIIFIIAVSILTILYDIGTYLFVGVDSTISAKIYGLSKMPVIGPIITFLTGALMYHLFVCKPGCG